MEGISLTLPVKDGRLDPTELHKRLIRDYLTKRNGKSVVVKLSRPTNTRSQQQNRFYWGVVLLLIAEHTGHTTEDVHSWFKDEFLPRRFVTIGGKEKEFRKTTTELTTFEFEQYLERVRAWAGENLGLVIPVPGQDI